MSFSRVTISFAHSMPEPYQYLSIGERTRSKHFVENFNYSRTKEFEVKIPTLIAADTYVGFLSSNFAQAFEIDHNQYDEYTIEYINGIEGSGFGKVIITAKYPGAVFYVILNEVDGAFINFENTAAVPGISPNFLIFTGNANDLSIPDQKVNIVAPGVWSIVSSVPSWLNIEHLSGTGSIASSIKPINYSGLDGGTYFHDIIYQIGTSQFTLSIELNIFRTLISPYEPGKPAFTLDQKNFLIQGVNSNTYFQFNSSISIHKFFTNEILERTVPQKVLLFNGRSEINLGKLIHRLMDKFSTINEFENQYKLATLNIDCKEYNLTDDVLVGSSILSDIKFVAGISKDFSSFGFLEFNSKPNRVTSKGHYLLNILIPVGNFELKTFKNGELINTKQLPTNTVGPICEKVTFANYFQGDQIEFKIDFAGQNNENAPAKKFYIFPDQQFSNVIVWENEFLLQSTFEFTNHHDIKMELERQSSKRYNGFVEKTVHHSISKENKLTINTGWIIKSDIDTLESLILSKRAFVKIGNKIVNLVPTSKALTNVDTSQDLYDYNFEFTINKTYNEETYTS